MNQLSGKPFTAYVGIDWADAKHDVCVQGWSMLGFIFNFQRLVMGSYQAGESARA